MRLENRHARSTDSIPSSLQHLHFQRTAKKPVSEVAANPNIAGWMFQMEAVRRVVERFAQKKRKALIVQATGTGKTQSLSPFAMP